MTTQNLTGPELNWGTNPNVRNLWGYGWKKGSNNPWQDEINQRRTAKFVFGLLGGPLASGILQGGFKAKDKLNPNAPFYGPEKKEDPQETRDDSPAIARERKRLLRIANRLNRAADWAAVRAHKQQYG
tara:strand:- start:352 stop:735 length:384 start_codon:yes stop_codon:yes gene_type:complete